MRAQDTAGDTITLGSLFSGIGGLDLGVEAATGARTVWQVERDKWCRSVLARHWPDARRYDDVCKVGEELERVDIIAGGFPCQDLSHAGKRAGLAGERSGLWREFARIIRVVGPRFVFVENVSGLLSDSGAMGAVLGDMAAMGFAAEWGVFRASDVGAPHRRERVFILAVADCDSIRLEGDWKCGLFDGQRASLRDNANRRGSAERGGDGIGAAESRVGSLFDGLPARLAGHRWPAGRGEAQHEGEPPRVAQGVPERRQRLKALGNAVVPQQAALAWRVLSARFADAGGVWVREPQHQIAGHA